jgi:hypothetical protein
LDELQAGKVGRAKNVHRFDDPKSLVAQRATVDDAWMDLRYPVGQFTAESAVTPEKRKAWIAQLDALPRDLERALASLPDRGLDTPYREGGWTVRQVVHHLADSHLNAYTRIKLALTEETPVIKTYEEQLWAELPDGRDADPGVSLAILGGVHKRLTLLLESLTPEQLARSATHPSWGVIDVDWLIQMYAWHCRHHLGHIGLVRQATRVTT